MVVTVIWRIHECLLAELDVTVRDRRQHRFVFAVHDVIPALIAEIYGLATIGIQVLVPLYINSGHYPSPFQASPFSILSIFVPFPRGSSGY
jgi:predicted membrane chloride channel (bestrophin family)